MKLVRILFSIALVGWTILFSLAGVVLSLFLNGPETAFLILWAAVAAVAAFVWLSIEGGVWFYRRLFVRIDTPAPSDVQESWRVEEPASAAATAGVQAEAAHDDPWAHAPDYETSEDQPDHREDEFPSIKEQFPRL